MEPALVPRRESRVPSKVTILLVALFVMPLVTPLSSVSGEPRVEARDFGVLQELSEMLDQRGEIIDSNTVSPVAEPEPENTI